MLACVACLRKRVASVRSRRRSQPLRRLFRLETRQPQAETCALWRDGVQVVVEVSAVSFQVTILKVLAGQPEGRLSLADLRNNVAILISSGPDWTDRTKRIAAGSPGLDIFSQGMVLRSPAGWQITDAGRAFLASRELPISSHSQERVPETVETKAPVAALPPLPLVGPDTRRRIWWSRRRGEKKLARSSVG
jgi:hypothetical protein